MTALIIILVVFAFIVCAGSITLITMDLIKEYKAYKEKMQSFVLQNEEKATNAGEKKAE